MIGSPTLSILFKLINVPYGKPWESLESYLDGTGNLLGLDFISLRGVILLPLLYTTDANLILMTIYYMFVSIIVMIIFYLVLV